jgi:hypothetical protein
MCNVPIDNIALIELRLSVRIRHLFGGRITSAMCDRAVNRALSSTVKTPAGLRILCPNPPTPMWTAKPAQTSI